MIDDHFDQHFKVKAPRSSNLVMTAATADKKKQQPFRVVLAPYTKSLDQSEIASNMEYIVDCLRKSDIDP